MKIIDEIVKKLNPGETSYYADRNNTYDTKTITDTTNEFDKFIKDKKNWVELIRAIYSNHSDFKSGKYVVAPTKKDGEYTVIDSKKPDNAAFNVKVYVKNNTLIINNLKSKSKDTRIELGTMIEASQPTETKESFADTVIKNLKDYKGKGDAKSVMKYIEALQKNYK